MFSHGCWMTAERPYSSSAHGSKQPLLLKKGCKLGHNLQEKAVPHRITVPGVGAVTYLSQGLPCVLQVL